MSLLDDFRQRQLYITRPCLYNLGWDASKTAIRVSVANLAIEQLLSAEDFIQFFEDSYESFKERGWPLDENVKFGNREWGFGGVIEPSPPKEPHYTTYEVRLPQVLYWDKDYGKRDYRAAYNVTKTLSLLFRSLYSSPSDPTSLVDEGGILPEKLIEISNMRVDPDSGFYGAPLYATVYRSALPWLQARSEEGIERVRTAMKQAHGKMWGETSTYDIYDFKLGLWDNGRFSLSCPGNACGLDMTRFNGFERGGEKLSPHNTDSPIHQLTLLAGLAAMTDEIRKFNSQNEK